jgi:hydroxyacylglutathione hydrolase
MKQINRDGPPVLGQLRTPDKLADEILANLLENKATVVDVRTSLAFARAHVPGTINIPYNGSFTGWAGSLIPYDHPFALIVDDRTAPQLPAITRDLSIIGLDQVSGYFGESAISGETITLNAVATNDLERLLDDDDVQIVDLRTRAEWEAGHIPGVPNIPLQQLADRMDELPRDKRLVLHCQSGARSAIGSSVLQAAGFDVLNVLGGYGEWAKLGKEVETLTPAAPSETSI